MVSARFTCRTAERYFRCNLKSSLQVGWSTSLSTTSGRTQAVHSFLAPFFPLIPSKISHDLSYPARHALCYLWTRPAGTRLGIVLAAERSSKGTPIRPHAAPPLGSHPMIIHGGWRARRNLAERTGKGGAPGPRKWRRRAHASDRRGARP
jgi:hypothetical protein